MELLENVRKIKHEMTEIECFEDLTDKQGELVSDIIDLLYDLIDELKKIKK